MPGSSQHQSNFLGGEWSKLALGRSDLPEYRSALERCLNAIPVEEGAWMRRPGTQRLGPSYLRGEGSLRTFQSSAGCSFSCEFTYQSLRFWSGTQLIFTNDIRQVVPSGATLVSGVIHITVDAAPDWAVGDQVMFNMNTLTPDLEGGCRGRLFKITSISGAALQLKDDLGNLLTLPTWVSGTLDDAFVYRVLRITTPYQSHYEKIKVVQAETQAIVLWPYAAPMLLTVTEPTDDTSDPTFTFAAVDFVDGPYLDPQGGVLTPEQGTASGTSGTITFTPVASAFDANDVGRLIRLQTEPAAWDGVASYTSGDTVKYSDSYWRAINSGPYATDNVNIAPGTIFYSTSGNSAVFWVPALNAASWGWGTITAQSGSSCSVTLAQNLSSTNPLTVVQWHLGVYKLGSYPTCGIYHEGRLLLAGAQANHFDMSMPYDPATGAKLQFSPSDEFGNVFDNHAISYSLNAKQLNQINWVELDHAGILAGTQSGEWLISASELSDPLTPTSTQAKQVSQYGSLDAEPRRAGTALLFVHRYGRRIYEFLSDALSAKYSGKPINERAKHLSKAGFSEMAYQEENNPIVWARDRVNAWFGVTYRRVSRFVTENPVFYGWHRHTHGSGGGPISLCVTPGESGITDTLFMMIEEPSGQVFVEVLTPIQDPELDT